MPATYEPIATTTLSSAASSITFSSIPATYTDLRLVVVGTSATEGRLLLRFNSDSGTNYSYTVIKGDGTNTGSHRGTDQTYWRSYETVLPTSNAGFAAVDIFSYAGSTNKTLLYNGSMDKNGSGTTTLVVGLWRDTSAISSIVCYSGNLTTTTYNFNTGTTATLYGILKA